MGPTKLELSTEHSKKKDFGLATCLLNNKTGDIGKLVSDPWKIFVQPV